ncbi:MAG: hypothetical protein MMC23_003901 [Stictis urceolatum]|nr:hypothetical protein [Stictis urceolata]
MGNQVSVEMAAQLPTLANEAQAIRVDKGRVCKIKVAAEDDNAQLSIVRALSTSSEVYEAVHKESRFTFGADINSNQTAGADCLGYNLFVVLVRDKYIGPDYEPQLPLIFDQDGSELNDQNRNMRVFVATIKTMGTSLKLHRANQVIFMEPQLTKYKYDQIVARAARPKN